MPIVEELCTITAKGQTTVPKSIRQALGVGYGGRIAFRVQDGCVSLHAVDEPDADPALAPFLGFLERDMASRPQVLAPLTEDFAARMAAAAGGVPDHIDEEIDGDVAF